MLVKKVYGVTCLDINVYICYIDGSWRSWDFRYSLIRLTQHNIYLSFGPHKLYAHQVFRTVHISDFKRSKLCPTRTPKSPFESTRHVNKSGKSWRICCVYTASLVNSFSQALNTLFWVIWRAEKSKVNKKVLEVENYFKFIYTQLRAIPKSCCELYLHPVWMTSRIRIYRQAQNIRTHPAT